MRSLTLPIAPRGVMRARILRLVMMRRAVGCCDIQLALDIDAYLVAYHMSDLRRRGLVAFNGRTGFYSCGVIPTWMWNAGEVQLAPVLASRFELSMGAAA